jgi:hypothetical protein
MVQSKETGSTISCLRLALLDRARVPVMLPRKSDSDMRRDGSNAACEQPDHAVDERGRVHGVPDLEHFAGLRILASRRVAFTAMEEEWRWRRLRNLRAQIRGQDKSTAVCRGANGCSDWRIRAVTLQGAPSHVRFYPMISVFRALAHPPSTRHAAREPATAKRPKFGPSRPF